MCVFTVKLNKQGTSMKLDKLIEMIERAYELGVQAQAGDPDQALSEEVTSECAEFLAVWEEDWGSFESMDIVDKDILALVTTLKANQIEIDNLKTELQYFYEGKK
jgi:hypothetical protein